MINNFEIGINFVKFQENSCKSFHGSLTDLEYIPRVVKHVCHPVVESRVHDRCLVEMYRLYIGLIETYVKEFKCITIQYNTIQYKFYCQLPMGAFQRQ